MQFNLYFLFKREHVISFYFSYGTVWLVSWCNADALFFELHTLKRYFIRLYNAVHVFVDTVIVVC